MSVLFWYVKLCGGQTITVKCEEANDEPLVDFGWCIGSCIS